nr:hypothetical protein [Tanacetum cinerariifolium]
FDNLDEFSGPVIPIHIVEEERIRREHADYINRMEMLFTINPRPHPSMYANMNVEFLSSLPIPIQEIDDVDDLRVDNSIQNSKHEFSESKDSDFDNLLVPLPPPEPPDEEFDFKIDFGNEILVVRNTIVEFECIDAKVKFDVFNDENDDLSYFMFVIFDKMFSFLSNKSEDTIFDPGGTFMKRHPEECYDLIENRTAHHNDWDTSDQRSESSSSITSSCDTKIAALKAEMAEIHKNLMRVLQVNQQVKAVTPNYETCGGPYSYNDCPATVFQTQNVYTAGAYQAENQGLVESRSVVS